MPPPNLTYRLSKLSVRTERYAPPFRREGLGKRSLQGRKYFWFEVIHTRTKYLSRAIMPNLRIRQTEFLKLLAENLFSRAAGIGSSTVAG
jgi:hypothetical protein